MIIRTYCTLRLFYVNNFTSCLFDTVWISSWPFSCTRIYTVSHRRTSPTTVCWWRKSVDFCDQLMHGHVSYRRPGPSLVTGALLWLDRGSWTRTLAALHSMTLTAFTAWISSWKRRLFSLVAAVAHSDYVFARYKYCYLLNYCYCHMSDKIYHETSINKTVKLHIPSSAVLEIENVNAKASNF